MNFFFIVNGKSIKQFIFIVVLALFSAWFLFLGNIVHIPVFSTENGPKAIYKGEKDLALTFNIGWGDEKPEVILDKLTEQKVTSATFFLSGSWAEQHPDLVQRIVKEGYEIGMLGYDYKDYTDLEPEKIRQDISKAQTAFSKLDVKDIKLIRAPTGNFNKDTLKIAEQLGYTVIHWSVNSNDWTNPGTETIIKNVEKAKNGDIILLHASDSALQTENALPAIINNIHKKGLKLVTVSEMIANANAESKEVK
ncbi:polysaccharide deacetylase family sporulation protein PdaB [Bacillaceae bacterium Marseille-Q3522]|nr:polysaccharide deacetylase family sporulation protein PdaB [Bacillaceae bacterium Marseille-Q3522]